MLCSSFTFLRQSKTALGEDSSLATFREDVVALFTTPCAFSPAVQPKKERKQQNKLFFRKRE